MVLGIRGIPGVEGGVETHAEHLYPRLASMGCDVTILVRSAFMPKGTESFGPIRLKRLWAPRTPGLEAFLHSLLGVAYAVFARPDILHVHAIGPMLVTPIARLLGLKVVVTHHGPDYDRDKWGAFARWTLQTGERLGMHWSNARIAISQVIQDHIRTRYNRSSVVIPNGVVTHELESGVEHVVKLGLQPGRYFLQVARMVPEKRQLDLIAAYRATLPSDWKLAIVGRLGTDSYSNAVAAAASGTGAVLSGFLTGIALRQVYSHAGAFVLPSSHEGLPIAMLEALSYGLPVLASNIRSNVAVGLEADCYFPLGDLSSLTQSMQLLSAHPPNAGSRLERRQWVATRYDWDQIAKKTLATYAHVITPPT
jgi:glycosyltransferase involved in cell wall biosynthesis